VGGGTGDGDSKRRFNILGTQYRLFALHKPGASAALMNEGEEEGGEGVSLLQQSWRIAACGRKVPLGARWHLNLVRVRRSAAEMASCC